MLLNGFHNTFLFLYTVFCLCIYFCYNWIVLWSLLNYCLVLLWKIFFCSVNYCFIVLLFPAIGCVLKRIIKEWTLLWLLLSLIAFIGRCSKVFSLYEMIIIKSKIQNNDRRFGVPDSYFVTFIEAKFFKALFGFCLIYACTIIMA